MKIKGILLLILFSVFLLSFLQIGICDIGLVATYPHAFDFIVPPGTYIHGSDLYLKLKNTGDVTLVVNITADPPFGVEVYLSADQVIIKPGKEVIIRFAINVTEYVVPSNYSFKITALPIGAIISGGETTAITLPAYAVPIDLKVSGTAYLLTVLVVDPIGNPIEDVLIQLYVVVDETLNQISEQKGVLKQKVIPGTYHIIVRRGSKICNQTRIEVTNDTTIKIVLTLVYFTEVSAGYLKDEKRIVVTFYLINDYKNLQNAMIVWEREVDDQPVDSGHIATWASLPVGRYGPFTISIEAKYGRNKIYLKFIVETYTLSMATAVVDVPRPENRFSLIHILFAIGVIAATFTLLLLVKKKIKIFRKANRRNKKSPGRVKAARRRKKFSSLHSHLYRY